MQISSIQLAASLTGITAKPVSELTTSSTESTTANHSAVEKSSESNPDRDAQGQGDGLGGPGSGAQHDLNADSESKGSDDQLTPSEDVAPVLPGEPPSQLDLLG